MADIEDPEKDNEIVDDIVNNNIVSTDFKLTIDLE